jgi:HEAT repeat protein
VNAPAPRPRTPASLLARLFPAPGGRVDAGSVLRNLLDLRPGEGRRTARAALFHFGFVAAVVLVKSASNALAVARYEASVLPPLYIATALATGLFAWAHSVVPRDPGRFPRGSLLLAAAVLGGLSLVARGGSLPAVTGLYLFGEVFATTTSIRYWTAAGELFDPGQGKRVFGLLGAAGMGGAIVAGLGAQLLGEVVGAWGLLPLGVTAILLTSLAGGAGRPGAARRQRARRAFLRLLSGQGLRAAAPEPRRAASRREAWRYLAEDPYPRALAVLMLLLAVLSALADYLFRARAGEHLGEDQLASLFGALNLWLGVVAVVFQLACSGRILARWGVFRYLLLTPLGAAAAALGCLVSGGLGAAFALRLVEGVGSLALNPAAFQLLYGPLPDAVRPGARGAIDGLVKKTGLAAGGALLLAVGLTTRPAVLAGLVLLVVGLYVLFLGRARRHYLRTIEHRLARPIPRAFRLVTAEARVLLERYLAAKEPRRVLLSLALLDETHFEAGAYLPRLFGHADARVRAAAARLAGRRQIARAAGHLERLVAEDVPGVRDEAALALAAVAPDRARAVLEPYLADPDPARSAMAVAALLRCDRGSAAAARALEERLAADVGAPPEPRRETARLLGRIGPSPYAARLADYLRDPAPEVRREAAAAVAAARERSLVPELGRLLGDRRVRSAVRAALASFGDEVVPELARLLDDWSVPLEVRLEIPRVLRAIGTEAAARALLFSRIQDDAYLRYRIAAALSGIGADHPGVRFDETRLLEATARRLDAYGYYLPVYRDLEAFLPPNSLLVRALADRLDQNLDTVFRLVQLRLRAPGLLAAFRRFAGGDARERAFARELLENLLEADEAPPSRRGSGAGKPGAGSAPGPQGARILSLLDRYHRLPEAWGGVPGQGNRGAARVLELAVSHDLLLRGLARHTARRLGLDVERILGPDVPMEHIVSESVIERVFVLEGVEIFSHCDVDDLAALASIARERSFAGGETIYREGDPGETFFVIVEGKVGFEKGGVRVVTCGVREAFGEVSLLDGAPRPVRAVALGAGVRLLAIERQDFLELVSDRPELLRAVFSAVARHVRQVLEGQATARLSAPAGEGVPARPGERSLVGT